ncbi:conserved domain protein [Actinomyces sp. oral taxon 170 str. F0386]|nr:conserved domain protein [Actinomyces sp. oral taxon 170 str. F0386]
MTRGPVSLRSPSCGCRGERSPGTFRLRAAVESISSNAARSSRSGVAACAGPGGGR